MDVSFSVGKGSHRQFEKDIERIKAAGISHWRLSYVAYKSKIIRVTVSEADAPKMLELGFHKSRNQ